MTRLTNHAPVRILQSRLLEPFSLVHAFTERAGGISPIPFDSLNLGNYVGDLPRNVRTNHERVYAQLGISGENVVQVHQVHGDRVLCVGSTHRGSLAGDADAMVSADRDVYMLMRFADCVPVLFYDSRKNAVGIAHAGWRGTAAGIVVRTVHAFEQCFGSNPGDILAVIGPSIGSCCYQVGPDVVDAMVANRAIPNDVIEHRGERGVFVDLWRANAAQLRNTGVQCVETMGICTFCHHQRFFSHRASGGQAGRFAAIIGLRGAKT